MRKNIKKMLTLLLALVLLLGLVACSEKDSKKNDAKTEAGKEEVKWPTKPVKAILHASAGGDTDFNARTFAEYFEKITGQPLIVTNMPGASGTASTEEVRQADKDGYTLLFTHTGPLEVNNVSGLIDYTYNDFDLASIPAVDGGTVLVTGKSSGIKSMDDLVKKLKAEPKSVTFGTEFGNYSHLQALILQDKADIEFKLADVGSASDKVVNILGGRIDVSAITYGSVKDYLQTGEMVALAQFNEEPNQNLGNVPTMKSLGIDMVMDKPYIIAFPKGTDPNIVERLGEISLEIAKNKDYAEKLKNGFSQEAKAMNANDAKAYLDKILAEYSKYGEVLKSSK